MRIAMINQPWNPALPPVEAGSIAIWNDRIASRLASKLEIEIYSRTIRQVPNDSLHGRVHYRREPASHGPVFHWRRLTAGSRRGPEFADDYFYQRYARRISTNLAKHQPDVVHVQNLSQFLPEFRRAIPDAKLLLHMHCEWLTQMPETVARERLQHADAVIGCSAYITSLIRKAFPDAQATYGVLANGVDTERFCPPTVSRPAGKRILFVGRVSPEKGLHVLLDAMPDVAKHHPDAELLIVGPDSATPREFLVELSNNQTVRALKRFYRNDSYYSQLCRQAAASGIRVTFAGAREHSELPEIYRDADVLVNPSLSESFGMSLIEAMSTGTPVVATQIGGMPEIVEHGSNGLLVSPDSATELAAALVQILSDAPGRQSLGESARARAVALYDWSSVAESTRDIYHAVTAAPA